MYDLIGDLHGHADELVRLLEALDYRNEQGVYRHPTRRVIFLGDLIDRGPKIRETLAIVRSMVAAGHARSVMGNHELNAVAFHTEDPDAPGEYLRRRTPKNIKQHHQTLEQLEPWELSEYLEWFRTLPLWLDLEPFRVVHACWDDDAIRTIEAGLQQHGGVTPEFLRSAYHKGEPLYAAVETVLKGREAPLPMGVTFEDKDGHVRKKFRTRWYLSPVGQTYRTYALQADEIPCDDPLDKAVIQKAKPYPATAKPVFVGHYWLSAKRPTLLADNVACLDYSVARGGLLCAYRWDGEAKLHNDHFVWVEAGR